MGESRVRYFETMLSNLGYTDSLKALDWMMEEMCVEKGFERHDGTHYYYHLVDSAQDLLNHGIRVQTIITACILHDSIEDIEGVTFKMIEDKFGHEVAVIVDLVTKKKGLNYKDPEVMLAYLKAILENVGASLVKTADRKHNFSTLRDATLEKKLRQALETEKLFIPFFKECRTKYPRYSSYFFSAKTSIEPHLFSIKENHNSIEQIKKDIASIISKSQGTCLCGRDEWCSVCSGRSILEDKLSEYLYNLNK